MPDFKRFNMARHWKDLFQLYRDHPSIYENNKDFFLEMVSQLGMLLKHVPNHFKNDKEVIKKAFLQDPNSFEYMSDILKKDEMFVIELLESINLVYYVSLYKTFLEDFKKLNNYELIALKFVKHKPKYFFDKIPEEFQRKKEFVLCILKLEREKIEPFIKPFLNDKDFLLELVKNKNTTFDLVPHQFREDKEIILNSLKHHFLNENENYIFEKLKKDYHLSLQIAKNDAYFFPKLNEQFKNNKKFILELLNFYALNKNEDTMYHVKQIMDNLSEEFLDDNEIVLASLIASNWTEGIIDIYDTPIRFMGSPRLKLLIQEKDPVMVIKSLVEKENFENLIKNNHIEKAIKI